MQIQGVRTPSECVRINWKDAHAYKENIYTGIRNDMNKVNKL